MRDLDISHCRRGGFGGGHLGFAGWYKTLHGKEETIFSRLLSMSSGIGAADAAIKRQVDAAVYGVNVDRLYLSLRNLQKAFIVAKRSYSQLDEERLLFFKQFVDSTGPATNRLHDDLGNPVAANFLAAERRFVNLIREANKFRDYARKQVG